ncbi:dynamin family protein [Paraburkholderia sp. J11-2]|uniref:dynamin family protein n=1 Tax=Paraburkholderia sp. J11-2 TaxID=2805431 RepID=UPI002AB6A367|nr:dynamin family protein [Paraburkholderia sp. J11-2]
MRNDRQDTFPAVYARRVGDAFVRIDACLTDALHYLDPLMQRSPFASRVADAAPVQHQMMISELELIRKAMQTITARHDVSLPAPRTSSLESCRLRISEAMLALSELDPRAAKEASISDGCGLTEGQEEDACRLVGHLMALLDGLENALAKNFDMTTRTGETLAGPGSRGPQRIPGSPPAQPLVSELERITASHGLGDLHRRCMDLARHLASPDIVVGFFGAVSAGKSSLINSLLGDALLPVAALPTTAVPVEIRYGKVARGTVEFAVSKTELIDRARIAEFVDEHSNSRNSRGVTRITFESPSPLLYDGTTVIDTPGVSWDDWDVAPVAATAAPWCDIAVVLISAAAPLTLHEAALVRQLSGHGARVVVLVTKVDLVGAEDRWRIYEHVVRGLWQSTQLEVPVYLVSTREEDPPWRRAWFDGPFAEALAQCRLQRAEIRRRQLATLRRDVLDAIHTRLMLHAPAASTSAQLDDALRTPNANRDAAHAAIGSRTGAAKAIDRTMNRLIDEIAHNAASLWSETHDLSFDATRLLELATNARALSLSSAAMRTVETHHASARVALRRVEEMLGQPGMVSALPVSFIAPAFALQEDLPTTLLARSWGRVFGRWGFYFCARVALHSSASVQVVRRALDTYRQRLETWKQRSLTSLAQALTEYIERFERLRDQGSEGVQPNVQRLKDDLAILGAIEHNDLSGK